MMQHFTKKFKENGTKTLQQHYVSAQTFCMLLKTFWSYSTVILTGNFCADIYVPAYELGIGQQIPCFLSFGVVASQQLSQQDHQGPSFSLGKAHPIHNA
jgi:hypothetical protein